jgi:hypothetical protein
MFLLFFWDVIDIFNEAANSSDYIVSIKDVGGESELNLIWKE